MMSLARALANWLSGTSTFLLTPVMSVNCSRRKSTANRLVSLRMSSAPMPRASMVSPRRGGFSVEGTVIGLRVGTRGP